MTFTKVLAIGLAGAVGTMARFAVGVVLGRLLGTALPWGTLTVNWLGCLAMGVVAGASSAGAFSEPTRLVLATGLLGGFTTYSAFNLELLELWPERPAAAVGYAASTLLGGVFWGLAGLMLAKRLWS